MKFEPGQQSGSAASPHASQRRSLRKLHVGRIGAVGAKGRPAPRGIGCLPFINPKSQLPLFMWCLSWAIEDPATRRGERVPVSEVQVGWLGGVRPHYHAGTMNPRGQVLSPRYSWTPPSKSVRVLLGGLEVCAGWLWASRGAVLGR
ncbi:hypothetical protein PLESTF_001002400 [Pleodorina starrii]|nr:hypothetical protein PLESTF_001002400 [Pleodorina starrii]